MESIAPIAPVVPRDLGGPAYGAYPAPSRGPAPMPAYGSYAVSGAPRLVMISQDGTPGESFPIAGEQIDIGRTEGELRLPDDPYVCARHARVNRHGGRFRVRDLMSVNGVYVRITRPVELTDGDLVLVGLQVLRFEAVTGAEQGLGIATERGVQVFGTPAAPRYARLAQRTVEGATRDVYYVTRDQTVLGRESGDIVFSNDPFMSRRHALLARSGFDRFSLRDLDSSNGTYLAIKGEREIDSGDYIRVGQHLFRLDA